MLEKKLKELLHDYKYQVEMNRDTYARLGSDEYLSILDIAIKQIKQAFMDEGRVQTLKATDKTIILNGKDPLGYIVYYPEERLTGPEWLARFEAEYHNKADWIEALDPDMADDVRSDIMTAARLAAGVEE